MFSSSQRDPALQLRRRPSPLALGREVRVEGSDPGREEGAGAKSSHLSLRVCVYRSPGTTGNAAARSQNHQ